jgi:hypothetical protein
MQIYKVLPIEEYNKLMQIDNSMDLDISSIISMLKRGQKTPGETVLKYITQTKDFGWNSNGEIVYKNNTENNSHILDLLSFATGGAVKPDSLEGLDTFIQVLKDYNISSGLLSSHISSIIHTPRRQEKHRKWIRFKI